MNVTSLTDLTGAYLASRPEWTLHAAGLNARDGSLARVEQPNGFHWADLAWQSEVVIRHLGDRAGETPVITVVRVTPDTLRRWKEVSINPFIEACAQLRDHWWSARPGVTGTLTLL
jgi:hypothetical protein